MGSSHTLDQLDIALDDSHAVANAGLLLASRADTGEVLHIRQRTGRANTARGTARFVDELAARVCRAGASGELTIRADSGFWSAKTIWACRRHGICYSITVRQTKPIRAAIATIAEDAWTPIVYPGTCWPCPAG